MRKTGIGILGEVPWGTHLCQFYQTKEDLSDILVPYFKAGLENNEFCMWVASEPFSRKETEDAMKKTVPEFDQYLKKGQIEIVPYTEWYFKDGVFDLQRVLNAWIEKLDQALAKGYEGIRVAGSTAWLEKKDWRRFTEYEEEVNNAISKYKLIAMCTYPLDKCGAHEIIDVAKDHQFAIIKQEGAWTVVKSYECKRAEEAFKESEEKLKVIVEACLDAIIAVDERSNIVLFNPAAEELFLYSSEEVLNKPVKILLRTDAAETHQKRLERVLNTGMGQCGHIGRRLERTFRRKGGTLFNAEVAMAGGRSNGKRIIVVSIHDVTERKKVEEALRESEERYRTVVEQSADCIYLADVETKRILEANQSFQHLLGYSSDEIPGVTIYDFVTHEREDIDDKIQKIVKGRSYFIGDRRYRRKDGNFVDVEVNASLISYGGRSVLCGVVRDITERKRAEEALRESETHFRLWAEKAHRSKDAFLDMLENVSEAYKELDELFMGFVKSIVNAIDARSIWTKGHSERVAAHAEKIAKEMGLDDEDIKKLRLAALLHDIGKIGTYDYLVDKPSRLTNEEFDIVKKHPVQGVTILKGVKQLKSIIPLIRYHHERLDGKGYPDGLKDEEIPLCARILHVADSFDSMTVDRPYRPAPGKEYAFLELKRCKGTQFDPQVAKAALMVL